MCLKGSGTISIHQAPVVRKADSAIHRINHHPADSMVCFVNTYPLYSDLSGGLRYPAFEQPGPDDFKFLTHVESKTIQFGIVVKSLARFDTQFQVEESLN